MRIILQSGDLLDALKHSAPARNTTLPVLTHVLIETAEGGVDVHATDLTARTRIRVEADVRQPGRVLLQADKLAAVAAGGGSLTIDDEGNVQRGRSRYSIGVMPAENFPEDPVTDWLRVEVDGAALRAAIDRVAYAVNDNDMRPFCRGVLLNKRGAYGATSVGMAHAPLAMDIPDTLIPLRHLPHLRELLSGGSTLYVSSRSGGRASSVKVEAGDLAASVQCIDFCAPDLDRVMAAHPMGALRLRVKRKEFADALKRFTPFADAFGKGVIGVALQRDEQGVALADKTGDSREDVLDLVTAPENAFCTAFNPRTVADALGVLDGDEAELAISETAMHLLPVGEGASAQRHLVMTIKL